MLKLGVCLLLVGTVLGFGISAPAGPGSGSSVLEPAEMEQLVGAGCTDTAGFMMSLGFAAGYLAALAPPISAGLLVSAALMGLGLVAFC
jgi:hypothetical protein